MGDATERGPLSDTEFWRTRAEELQTALDSRVVIEQAKGVLAQRFGCGPPAAFEILRRNARSSRRSIHELAAEIVQSASTTLKNDPIFEGDERQGETDGQ